MDIKDTFPWNCLQHILVYIEKSILALSLMSKDYICLQEPSPIFVGHLARLGQPVPRSLGSDVSTHLVYLGCHASLLPLIFMAFRIIVIPLSHWRSKYVIAFNDWQRSDAECRTRIQR
jgi:hypothetical protein